MVVDRPRTQPLVPALLLPRSATIPLVTFQNARLNSTHGQPFRRPGDLNRQTRKSTTMDDVVSKTDGHMTPRWIIEAVEAIVGAPFDLDACAAAWNAQCDAYFDEEADALVQDWTPYRRIWCNAPWNADLLAKFVRKAIEAAEAGSTVALLLPGWTGYEWFQDLKARSRIHDVVGGPVIFEAHDGSPIVRNNGSKHSPLVVAILGPGIEGGANGEPIRKPGTNGEPVTQLDRAERPVVRRSGPRMVLASLVQPKTTEWLWYPRIPLGELSMLDGDPGDNKSSFTTELTMRVTTGAQMPDGTRGVEGGAVLCLAEDSWEKTVRPRLDAAGANVRRIMFMDNLTVPRDREAIAKAIGKTKAKLVVIDPMNAFITADANSDQKIRQALMPLRQMADELNVAVLMVRHLVKRGGKSTIYMGLGSIGIIAAARSGLLVRRCPDDEDLRVLCHHKTNLGPFAPSLLYEPVDDNGVVRIEWRGECDYKADDLIGQTRESRIVQAITFLAALLASGPVPQGTVKAKAIGAGLAWRTVERAKEVLGIVAERKGFGTGSQSIWRTPPNGDVGGVWAAERN
jgi:phage N-6-adenine-methyltransferase